jgi:hypothetical protein
VSASAPLLLLALLLAAPSRGQGDPSGAEAAVDDPTLDQVKQKLATDPAFADMIAQRLDRSRLAPAIAPNTDGADRLKAVKAWVASDPDAAARLSVGLYGDDAAGNTLFEDNVLRQMRMSVVDNTKGNKGVLGRLRDTAKDSSLLNKQQEQLSDDEKREITRTLFEGQGGESNSVLNQGASGPRGPGGAAGPAVGTGGVAAGFSGYYDRLSGANLHGYSPQLLALQNALNQRRAPGAPLLIETGKLDYATLAYPAYAMEYDVRGLESRIARDRVMALARLAGVQLAERDWRDPDLEKKLLAKVPADRLPPGFKRRAELDAKARAALVAFLDAADAAKDPALISKAMVVGLGRLQQDAARWITAAALEEDVSRLDALDDFMTPDLRAAIDACPVAPPTRAAYAGRGEELKSRLTAARADTQKAEDLLVNEGWQSALGRVDRLTSSERAERKALERVLPVYVRVPYRLAGSASRQPGWRDWLDDLALKWLPSSAYAQSVSARRARLARWLGVFEQIARENLDGAASAAAALDALPAR